MKQVSPLRAFQQYSGVHEFFAGDAVEAEYTEVQQ
jgi:hypothetical protein